MDRLNLEAMNLFDGIRLTATTEQCLHCGMPLPDCLCYEQIEELKGFWNEEEDD